MIDRHELLATLKPLVTQLEESIRERALATPEVAVHLEQEHQKAVTAERTAMSFEEWRDGEITQAAVAWVLGCVFVRFLEDNLLIDQALISGPGPRRAAALGYREEHFRSHPAHSDREYFEACFRAVGTYPAVAALYDESHNPLWRLGPTADGARVLRETFIEIDPDSGELICDFADPGFGTRFLGDLYQDLSDEAKKRYALLQTPEFVERFILDRTLTPAIEEFGLEDFRLLDPTCGSGHFLVDAFGRLFALWQEREPATPATVLAQRCLDQIAGVDLNPYATAIARFRLVIAALKNCGIRRLAEAPVLRLQLATGDSLLHGPLPDDGATMLFDRGRFDNNIAHVYESEDASALQEILGRGYHAVVGNPPYIAVQDAALRSAYRDRYSSCHGQFVMTVPFMERFFELARPKTDSGRPAAGFVGKITGNNFMKREFGAPLVEKFLPSVDVNTIIDASGAYIPGHATPTILLFARSRPPVSSELRVIDGIRGEPRQPADPAEGLVWTSIETLIDQPGSRDRFVRSSEVPRAELSTHPMTLGIGRDVRRLLEQRGHSTVATYDQSPGFMAMSHADEAFDRPPHSWPHRVVDEGHVLPAVAGDGVRDWSAQVSEWTFFSGHAEPGSQTSRQLWPLRTELLQRSVFGGGSYRDAGRAWWEWHQFADRRFHDGHAIAWGEVATHNHFVLDRSGKLFKQTAPVIKLKSEATDDDNLELLGILNTSVACFWLKQVCQDKGVGGIGGGIGDEPWEPRYAFNSSNVKDLPLASVGATALARELDAAASERDRLLEVLEGPPEVALADHLAALRLRDEELTGRMVSRQEELDWLALRAYGLVLSEEGITTSDAPAITLGQRAFEIVLARQVAADETETAWFERHGSKPITVIPADWPDEYRRVVERRIALIEDDPTIGLIERPEYKRRWNRPPWEERQREALRAMVLNALDDRDLWGDVRLRSTNELTDWMRETPRLIEALELLADLKDVDVATTTCRLVGDVAVPHLAAQRMTEQGLRKRRVWEEVWELQRLEDEGRAVKRFPALPRYAKSDFRGGVSWKQRGKLDVPKERFVLVPFAERGADTSPVVGWARWDERDLARALAGRVMELREQEAVGGERLASLLAGVLELLPWIDQWYPDSDPAYGGTPGHYFEGWLDGQLAELSITRDNLRAWRPSAPTRGRKAKAGSA